MAVFFAKKHPPCSQWSSPTSGSNGESTAIDKVQAGAGTLTTKPGLKDILVNTLAAAVSQCTLHVQCCYHQWNRAGDMCWNFYGKKLCVDKTNKHHASKYKCFLSSGVPPTE